MPFTDTLKYVQVVSDDSGLLSAVPEDVVDGKIFIGKAKTFKTGTLPKLQEHETDILLSAGDSYTVEYGFNPIEYDVNVKTLSEQTVGDALPEHLLVDKIAWVNGVEITGTMPDNGADNHTLMAGEAYTIPLGYHNGMGVINCPSLAAQTAATASKEDILLGKTAWVNGEEVTGIMPDNGSVSQTLYCGETYNVPLGYHDGNGSIIAASLASQTPGTAHDYEMVQGVIAWVNGEMVTGTVPTIPQFTHRLRIDASGYSSYTVPAGFHEADSTVYVSISTMNGSTIAPGTDDIVIETNGSYLYGDIIVKGVDAYEYWQHDSETPTEIFLPNDTSITGTDKVELYRCEVHNWRDNATINSYGIRLKYDGNIYDGCLFINNLGDSTLAGNTRATRMNIGSNSLYLTIELDPETKAHVFYLNSDSLSDTANITDVRIESLLDLRVFGEERHTPDPILPENENYVDYDVTEDEFIQKVYLDIVSSGHYTLKDGDSKHIAPTTALTMIDQNGNYVNILEIYYEAENSSLDNYDIHQYIVLTYLDEPGIYYKKYFDVSKPINGSRTTTTRYTNINTTWYEPIETDYSSVTEFPIQGLTISYPSNIDRDTVSILYHISNSTTSDEYINNITNLFDNVVTSVYYTNIDGFSYNIEPTSDLIVTDQDGLLLIIDSIYNEKDFVDGKNILVYSITLHYADIPNTKYKMYIEYNPDTNDSTVSFYEIIDGLESVISKTNFPIEYLYIKYPAEKNTEVYSKSVYDIMDASNPDNIAIKFIDDLVRSSHYTKTGSDTNYTYEPNVNIHVYDQNDEEIGLTGIQYIENTNTIKYIITLYKDYDNSISYIRESTYSIGSGNISYSYYITDGETTTIYNDESEFPIKTVKMLYVPYISSYHPYDMTAYFYSEELTKLYDDIIKFRRYKKYDPSDESNTRIVPDNCIEADYNNRKIVILYINSNLNENIYTREISMYYEDEPNIVYDRLYIGTNSSATTETFTSTDLTTSTVTSYDRDTYPIKSIGVSYPAY